MHRGNSADDPNRGRYLYRSFEITILIFMPPSQRRIVPCPGCVGVGACFYCSSVVSRCKTDCCDPIHHSLVMGSAPVRIGGCESVGLNDSVNDLLSSQILS